MKKILIYLLSKQWILSIIFFFSSKKLKRRINLFIINQWFIIAYKKGKDSIDSLSEGIGKFGLSCDESAKAFETFGRIFNKLS